MRSTGDHGFRLTVNDDVYEGRSDEKERLRITSRNKERFDPKVSLRLSDRLIDFLHEVASKTGTKFGCGIGACGACKVAVRQDPEVQLIPSVADLSGIPAADKNQIVVADVAGVLHFRIFAPDGGLKDTNQKKILEDLAKQAGRRSAGLEERISQIEGFRKRSRSHPDRQL
jgi:hypothetical protein